MMRVLPPTNQICLATISACCRMRKVVAEVDSCSTFCKKISTSCTRFTGPRQTCFVASDVTPTYFFLSESNMHATCTNLICCETGLNVGGKMRNVFVVRFTVALSIHGANHSQKRNIIIKHFIIQLDLLLFPCPQRPLSLQINTLCVEVCL